MFTMNKISTQTFQMWEIPWFPLLTGEYRVHFLSCLCNYPLCGGARHIGYPAWICGRQIADKLSNKIHHKCLLNLRCQIVWKCGMIQFKSTSRFISNSKSACVLRDTILACNARRPAYSISTPKITLPTPHIWHIWKVIYYKILLFTKHVLSSSSCVHTTGSPRPPRNSSLHVKTRSNIIWENVNSGLTASY